MTIVEAPQQKAATGSRRGPKGPMTAEHKAALAAGRTEGHAIRAYLEALKNNKPKRGRKRTPDTIKARLAAIDTEITTADPVAQLRLVQEQLDLTAELAAMQEVTQLDELQLAFIEVAKAYSARNGYTYAAWRTIGVDPRVLKDAGIARDDKHLKKSN